MRVVKIFTEKKKEFREIFLVLVKQPQMIVAGLIFVQ